MGIGWVQIDSLKFPGIIIYPRKMEVWGISPKKRISSAYLSVLSGVFTSFYFMSIRMTIPNVSVAHIFWETINRNHGLGIVISSPEIEREQGISLVFRWDGLTIGKVCDAEGSSLLGPQLHFVLADKVFRNHIHT